MPNIGQFIVDPQEVCAHYSQSYNNNVRTEKSIDKVYYCEKKDFFLNALIEENLCHVGEEG